MNRSIKQITTLATAGLFVLAGIGCAQNREATPKAMEEPMPVAAAPAPEPMAAPAPEVTVVAETPAPMVSEPAPMATQPAEVVVSDNSTPLPPQADRN